MTYRNPYVHLVIFRMDDGREHILGAFEKRYKGAQNFADNYGNTLHPEEGSYPCMTGCAVVQSCDLYFDEWCVGRESNPHCSD